MKFSIITVSFNSEKTIEETIKSVVSQTYKDFEYILVDGGSSDNTVKIANRYKKYFKYIVSEKDNGIYDAINKGINLASGNIISILHSDDLYYSENVLLDVKNIFNKDENIKCVIGNTLIYKLKNGYKKVIRNYKSKHFYNWMMYLGYSPPHPSTFIRKEIYSQFGLYNTKYKIAGDFEFFLRILFLKKIKLEKINQSFVLMKLGGESTKSIINHNQSTVEILDSFKTNNLKNYFLIVMLRIPLKLIQYFLK